MGKRVTVAVTDDLTGAVLDEHVTVRWSIDGLFARQAWAHPVRGAVGLPKSSLTMPPRRQEVAQL